MNIPRSSIISLRETGSVIAKKSSLNVRDGLLKMKADLLNRLVALSSDKKEAENIVEELAILERALESTAPNRQKYAAHKSAKEPILRYLDEAGRPQTAQEIEDALVAGGFGGGEAARTRIKQSIGAFVKGHLKGNKTLKEKNGKIGRDRWDESLFE